MQPGHVIDSEREGIEVNEQGRHLLIAQQTNQLHDQNEPRIDFQTPQNATVTSRYRPTGGEILMNLFMRTLLKQQGTNELGRQADRHTSAKAKPGLEREKRRKPNTQEALNEPLSREREGEREKNKNL